MKGMPVLTENKFGERKSDYYVAARSSEEFYTDFLRDVCGELSTRAGQLIHRKGWKRQYVKMKTGTSCFYSITGVIR